MKNLSIIIVGAFVLLFILFACQNEANNLKNNSYAESVVSQLIVDSLQSEFIPVSLEWNEVVLALFIVDDQTCELLVGYRTSKYSAIATFAHRKIVVIGTNGYWNRKAQTIFVTKDGRNMKLVPAYPPNSVSPMPKKPFADKPLQAAEPLPPLF